MENCSGYFETFPGRTDYSPKILSLLLYTPTRNCQIKIIWKVTCGFQSLFKKSQHTKGNLTAHGCRQVSLKSMCRCSYSAVSLGVQMVIVVKNNFPCTKAVICRNCDIDRRSTFEKQTTSSTSYFVYIFLQCMYDPLISRVN